ncbi:uncharacterized protein PG986_001901 [Apiospora aurea]|uniref:Uncharacterized protein n=1 Tax=Apiospora aurea TaxID=335848 RepID=A0ABR1QYC4_9PEZI
MEPIRDLFPSIITQLRGQQLTEPSDEEESDDSSSHSSSEDSISWQRPMATLRPAGFCRVGDGGDDGGDDGSDDENGEANAGDGTESNAVEEDPENTDAEEGGLFVGNDPQSDMEPLGSLDSELDTSTNHADEQDLEMSVADDLEPNHEPGLGSHDSEHSAGGSASLDTTESLQQLADLLQQGRLDDLAQCLWFAQPKFTASSLQPQNIPEMIQTIKKLEAKPLEQDVLRRYVLKQLAVVRYGLETEIRKGYTGPAELMKLRVLQLMSLKGMMALAYPDIPAGRTLKTSTQLYQHKHFQLKQQLAAGRIWCKLDSHFGNGTFALIPVGHQSKIERLNEEEFTRFLELLYPRFDEIRELSRGAAQLLPDNLANG